MISYSYQTRTVHNTNKYAFHRIFNEPKNTLITTEKHFTRSLPYCCVRYAPALRMTCPLDWFDFKMPWTANGFRTCFRWPLRVEFSYVRARRRNERKWVCLIPVFILFFYRARWKSVSDVDVETPARLSHFCTRAVQTRDSRLAAIVNEYDDPSRSRWQAVISVFD